MSTQGTDDTQGPGEPGDAALLAAVGRLWQLVDPPPVDLADGVLARLAAEDLDFELLTLVESEEALSGVRSTAEPVADTVREGAGSWSLEYAHADFRVYLRLSRSEERTRLDGWVVPAQALTVRLLSEAEAEADPAETVLDEFGRFEFASVPAGLARLVLTDEPPTAERPRITPPFWI